MNLIGIPQSTVGIMWSRVEPFIARVSGNTVADYSPGDIQAGVSSGEMQLWAVVSGPEVLAAVVTRLNETSKRKVCEIIYAGSADKVGDWGFVIEGIEEWARDAGCSRVMLAGRKGWLRALQGYEQTAVVMERAI